VLSLALAAIAAGAACIPSAHREGRPLLDRIAYGPSAADAAHMLAVGPDAFVEEQLHPERIDDAAFEARLAGMTTLRMPVGDVMNAFGGSAPDVPYDQLVDAKILRSIYSRRQLEAVLVDFWMNHFQVRDSGLTIGALERDAIRPHVLGRFEDMLVAVARSPAMMIFLDTVLNVREGALAEGVEKGINENYARELLELHTVGTGADYTQQDVIELARCFTGWNVDWSAPDGFVFVGYLHDPGAKHVLGLTLPAGGGEQDGLRVLSYLATHPWTARRIATKLIQRFVDEDAPPALVEAATATFRATGGDLRAVMRTILGSTEMRRAAVSRDKVKRPLVLVASTVRALGLEVQGDLPRYRDFLGLLGEFPYAAPDPRGYPEDSDHWTAPGAMLARLQFVQTTVSRATSAGRDFGATGAEPSSELVRRVANRLGLRGLSAASSRPIEDYADRIAAGSSPSLRRAEVAGLVLSSTRFLTH
jgi:uncharacterized protein (DUF1800 family)